MLTRESAVVVLGIALAGGCSRTGTGPTEQPRYFPLTVGNTWTYAPEDPMYGQSFEWRVTERTGDTVTVVRPPGGSHAGTVTLLDRLDQVELLLGDNGYVPFYEFAAGTSWVHRDPWECDDGAELMAVEEPNPIITPAGTFQHTVRIERRTTASCADAGTMVEWWAPDVGLVQWQELNFYAGGPLTYQLISYAVE